MTPPIPTKIQYKELLLGGIVEGVVSTTTRVDDVFGDFESVDKSVGVSLVLLVAVVVNSIYQSKSYFSLHLKSITF